MNMNINDFSFVLMAGCFETIDNSFLHLLFMTLLKLSHLSCPNALWLTLSVSPAFIGPLDNPLSIGYWIVFPNNRFGFTPLSLKHQSVNVYSL